MAASKPPLPDEAIEEILTSPASHSAMGRRYGRSHESIRQIRYGETYVDRCPETPRWSSPASCDRCHHWTSGRCDLGHIDPLEEGMGFARWCSNYRQTQV